MLTRLKKDFYMIHYYAIYDRKAKAFGELLGFGSSEKQAAQRWFKDIIMSDQKSLLYRYPHDFDLFYIGFFDKKQGEFVLEVTDPETGMTADIREFIINAGQFFADQQQDSKE